MIPFVDLHSQYLCYREEIHAALQEVLDSTQFVGGAVLDRFEQSLASYINDKLSPSQKTFSAIGVRVEQQPYSWS